MSCCFSSIILSTITIHFLVTLSLAFPVIEHYGNNTFSTCLVKLNTTYFQDLTVVNFEDNQLLKMLHTKMNLKISQRSFLATNLYINNEFYVVQVKDKNDLAIGLDNLVKDYFWNPGAKFLFIFEDNPKKAIASIFELLHQLYIYKAVVIAEIKHGLSEIYRYNFEYADHCIFTKEAIEKHECKNVDPTFIDSVYKKIEKKLYVSKERQDIPYSGCQLNLLILEVIPGTYPRSPDNQTKVIGYEEVFYTTINDMGLLNINIIYDNKRRPIGSLYPNFTATGVFRDVLDGTVDGVVGAIILAVNRIGPFDFVYPHLVDRIVLIVSKASLQQYWRVIFKTFPAYFWLFFCIVFAVFCFLGSHVKIYKQKSDSLIFVIFSSAGYLFGTTVKNVNNNHKSKLLIVSWVTFTWLVNIFFQSNLTSVFTTPVYDRQINTVNEIISSNYTFYLTQRLRNYYATSNYSFVSDILDGVETAICNNIEDCMMILSDGDKKFSLSSMNLNKFYEASHGQNIYTLKEAVQYFYLTAFVKKGHPDLERLRFLESQMISSFIQFKTLNDLTFSQSLKSLVNQDPTLFNVLSLRNLVGIYYLLFFGWIIAIVVFAVELYYGKKNV